MKEQLKDMVRPYAMLFSIALTLRGDRAHRAGQMDLTERFPRLHLGGRRPSSTSCSILTGSARFCGVFMYGIAGDGRPRQSRRTVWFSVSSEGAAGRRPVSVGRSALAGHRVPG